MTETKTAQDILIQDYFYDNYDEDESQNETLELLEFFKVNGTPLTNDQVRAMFLLNEFGLNDISTFVLQAKREVTPTKKFFTLIDKLTLASRIKGNAKLSSILKANANPANAAMPSSDAISRKALKERGI